MINQIRFTKPIIILLGRIRHSNKFGISFIGSISFSIQSKKFAFFINKIKSSLIGGLPLVKVAYVMI